MCMCVDNKAIPSCPSIVQNETFQHRAPVQISQTDSAPIHHCKQLCNSLIFSFTNWLIPHTINLPMSFEGILPKQMHNWAQWIYSLVAICCYGNSGYPQTKHVAQQSCFCFVFSFSVVLSNLLVLLMCQRFAFWLLEVRWVGGQMDRN